MKQKLYELALATQKNAYAPYSTKKISAAVLSADGKMFSGCNIENASFGATVCAERVAIWKAVSEGAKLPIQEVVVISDANPPWPPCGMCRQVLSEFGNVQTQIHIANLQGIQQSLSFDKIFPMAFGSEHLKK